jgi:hypothetical protein
MIHREKQNHVNLLNKDAAQIDGCSYSNSAIPKVAKTAVETL